MKDPNEATLKAIQGLLRRQIEADAKADAMTGMLALLCKKVGIANSDFATAMKQMEDAALQRRLEIVENHNPSLAAELDQRQSPGQ